MRVEVTGLDEALNRIDKEIDEIENKSQAGFWEAGLMIIRRAQQNLKASVVTGNLRASAYVRNKKQDTRPDPSDLIQSENEGIPNDSLSPLGVETGFTANYALNVHENPNSRTPKYLERVITRNERAIANIIRKRSNADG